MFNKNFYPTPKKIIEEMIFDLEINQKTILEPSAGKGNIVDFLKDKGAKEILTFENNKDLATIVKNKSTFLGSDFLIEGKKEDLSHIDFIIANPPFDQADQHILKMWEIAPEGCTIISLCNKESLENNYTRSRRQLMQLIKENGEKTTLGHFFNDAERKTNVNVGIVKLFKPVVKDFNKFEGFFMDEEQDPQGNGIMPYNEVRAIVQNYVGAVEQFQEVEKAITKLNSYAKPLGASGSFTYSVIYGDSVTDKERFAKSLQKTAWKYVFEKMKVKKFVTSGVMEKVNKFVESQTKYPFTMRNIYKMIDIIIQTRGQTFNESIIDVFDKITRHHHENRYEVEGWKTNKSYLVGKKFILDWTTEQGYNGEMKMRYNGNVNKINDFQKALKYLSGSSDEILESQAWSYKADHKFSTWYTWGFFEIKGFKKGTLHCKFKDEKVWELFNRKIAEIKGFELPEKL
jgi:predicted RNA methylase